MTIELGRAGAKKGRGQKKAKTPFLNALIWEMVRLCASIVFPKPLPSDAGLIKKVGHLFRCLINTVFALCVCAVLLAESFGFGFAEARIRSVIEAQLETRECLQKAIFFEGPKEPFFAQLMVAWTVLNRADAGEKGLAVFPRTPCAVIYQQSKPTTISYVHWSSSAQQNIESTIRCALQYRGLCYEARYAEEGPLWENAGERSMEALVVYQIFYRWLPSWFRSYTYYAVDPPASWKAFGLNCDMRFGTHKFCYEPSIRDLSPDAVPIPLENPHRAVQYREAKGPSDALISLVRLAYARATEKVVGAQVAAVE